jgi:L-fuconate dehydratase
VIRDGHYTAPLTPGFSATVQEESLAEYRYPDGTFWVADRAEQEEVA